MSARDDYRWLAAVEGTRRDAALALDEIDRLRADMTRAAVMRLDRENRELHAEVVQLRRLADLNALRRTLTNPALRRLTRPVDR